MRLEDIFVKTKPIIAVIRLEGSGADSGERALREAELFLSQGVDALMIEADRAHASEAEKALLLLRAERPDYRCGLHIVDDPAQSCALAEKCGSKFALADSIRGSLSPEEVKALEEECAACAERGKFLLIRGVDSSDEAVLRRTMKLCGAIAVDGTGLGSSPLREIKGVLRSFPLIISGGISPENLKERLLVGDGAIISSLFREDGKADGGISVGAVKEVMTRMASLRSATFLLKRLS